MSGGLILFINIFFLILIFIITYSNNYLFLQKYNRSFVTNLIDEKFKKQNFDDNDNYKLELQLKYEDLTDKLNKDYEVLKDDFKKIFKNIIF